MRCLAKDELEQHLSHIRRFAARLDLTSEERDAAVQAERFAIQACERTQYIGTQREEMPTRHTTLRPNLTSVAFAEESRATNNRRGCRQVSVDSTTSQYCPRHAGANRPGPSLTSSAASKRFEVVTTVVFRDATDPTKPKRIMLGKISWGGRGCVQDSPV
jgi:hypothetical protein